MRFYFYNFYVLIVFIFYLRKNLVMQQSMVEYDGSGDTRLQYNDIVMGQVTIRAQADIVALQQQHLVMTDTGVQIVLIVCRHSQ